ncbi:MAG: DNA mismatch repair protein MutS [Acutalibacteraceae bacterium]
MVKISPMMQQYLDIKNKYKDSILFFRLGDFYEMFFDDAKLASEELDLTLTGKDYGQDERAPMCGVPYHSCESYISRLVSKGYKVAMCEQMELPSEAKGLVKREVVRIITPGTVTEDSMLDESRNNYLASVYYSKKLSSAGVCFCDVSTGELKVTEVKEDCPEILNLLKNEMGKFSPTEVLVGGDIEFLEPLKSFFKEKLCCRIEVLEEDVSPEKSKKIINEHFKNDEIKKWNKESALRSLGNLFEYLKQTQKNDLSNIKNIYFFNSTEFMGLDLNTVRNLEIVETMRSKQKKGSLLWVLDKTKTSMGKRLLRSWIERPLIDLKKISYRQDAVEEMVNEFELKDALRENLSGISDIQRLMTKISYGTASPKDLKALSATLKKLPEIKYNLFKCNSYLLKKMCEKFDLLKEVYMLIEDAIKDDPPFIVREGKIIKDGYSAEVDSLRKDLQGGSGIVADIEEREKKRTGAPKLKVKYNKIFGYYIEIPNSYKGPIPEEYIRKQTLANCERYITDELKQVESRILYAHDKINEVEYRIFEDIRKKVAENLTRINAVASILSNLDVILSLAEVAYSNNYVKPAINSDGIISITEGRHPVVEVLLKGAPFVPNNTELNEKDDMISIITGPNMAGKSTYMRQNALIVLMAQMGSFVPAKEAKIGIVDNIFTRIGASDDLASGQSTFMVEMNEVADILKNSTSKSLIILDEVGRGTSTFDGMSIAKAVLEYISKFIGAKTLFATHYHELTTMVDEFKNIKNYNIAVKRRGDDITFLRRIVPGAADESYGIEVAKLAGVPENIINRAKQILKKVEQEILESKNVNKKISHTESQTAQLEFSDMCLPYQEFVNHLKNLDVSVLTPIEAMNMLYKLVKEANQI